MTKPTIAGLLAAGLGAVLLAAPALAHPGAATPASAPAAQDTAPDQPGTITVMARNLYLGADVTPALELLPDVAATLQFMWNQVAANDFGERVDLLAQEAAEVQPHVIGLQEATVWSCRPSPFSAPVPVFDFTEQFLAATVRAGTEYRIAERDGVQAINPGYEIPAVPIVATVEDPATFQPLFGKDSAECGFTIGDALLVRADLADSVLAVGNSEYEDRYAVVPVVFTIDRGYTWADIEVAGTTVRAVATHLESLWPTDGVPPSAEQAKQLVEDLADTTVPVVVIGDFNSDPRDPRGADDPNPGGQPEAGASCQAQPAAPTRATADASCNAYWTMVEAGYTDAGPDALAGANFTWGSEGDLAGPNPERLEVALEQGNKSGFTDRLDYVFTRNGATALSAEIIGNSWPDGDTWQCDAPEQIRTTEESSRILAEAGVAEPIVGRGVCLPTDHAGIVAVVDVSAGPPGVSQQAAPPDHQPLFRIGMLGWILILLGVLLIVLLLLLWGVYRLATRGRRRRKRAERAAADLAGSSVG